MTDSPNLTPQEVADDLGIDVRTVYQMLRNKEIEHLDLGYRTKRIPREAFERFKAERGVPRVCN